MVKKLAYTLILATIAVLAASCAQPFVAPASPVEGAGRVVLRVSAGETAGRTILPKTIPAFSRYELDFSKDGATVTADDTSDIAGDGVSQELTAGTWTVEVRAYRRFAPTGGSETEYLAARGGADILVVAGQLTPATISIEPVPVTGQDAALKGIFTYTVTFPDGVDASLSLVGGGSPITKAPVSGDIVSLELAAGYYDLFVTLTKTAGGATFTAGAADKAHIYAGLESEAAYEFTDEDFVQIIPFAGTIDLPAGATLSSGTISVYSDSAYADLVVSAAIPQGGTRWAIDVPAGYIGSALYFRLDAVDSALTIYAATASKTATAAEGDGRFALTLSAITPASMTINEWSAGAISSPGKVDWHKFTAGTAETYYLQWDDKKSGAGEKTLDVLVSAYRSADGTPLFSLQDSGYASPKSVSVGAGETVDVQVEGQDRSIGTYALRYYKVAAPGRIQAVGTPAPSCVIGWDGVSWNAGYKVYRSDTVDGTYTLLGTISNGDGYAYTDATVTAGTTYYYKVRATIDSDEGLWSAAASCVPPDTTIATPLTHNTWAEGTISSPGEVHWYSFVAESARTNYNVQVDDWLNNMSRGMDSGRLGTGDKTAQVDVSAYRGTTGDKINSNSMTLFVSTAESESIDPNVDNNVEPGQTIYVRVAGLTHKPGSYAIQYYNVLTVPPQYPPENIIVQGNPYPASYVAWRATAGDITWAGDAYYTRGYKVYRATSAEGSYTLIATLDGYNWNISSYADTGVVAGTTYYYKVSFINLHGEGVLSAAVSDTSPVAANIPTLTHNVRVDGNVSFPGETHWYQFTADSAGDYSVDWIDAYDAEDRVYLYISVYRSGDAAPINFRYTYDLYPFSVGAGETIFVRAEGQIGYYSENRTGPYSIRYYKE
jgi:fibronectin type 3 domain-containing protein